MSKSTMRSATRAVLTFAVLTMVAIGCAARQPLVVRDDVAITKDVQDRLAADPVSSTSKIAVETKAGVVSLRGAVTTDTVRETAERLARATPGVTGVDNNLRFGGGGTD